MFQFLQVPLHLLTRVHIDNGVLCTLAVNLQYCRVSKDGLPKNGLAGILPKNKNAPGWNEELHVPDRRVTIRPHMCLPLCTCLGMAENKNENGWMTRK